MRSVSRTSRLLALVLSVAITAGACGGGDQAAVNEDLEDQVAEAKELAYQAALSAEEAKNAAAQALAAAGGAPADGAPADGSETPDDQTEADDAAAAATTTTTAGAEAEGEVEWSYSGETGPDAWAGLSEKFALCEAGMEQSPIDLMGRTLEVGLDDIAPSWAPSNLTMVDTGRTIRADVAPGNTTTIDGVVYDLIQFHFHKPAEHTVGTEVFPMELHFVHASAEGALAMVGVLVAAGEANPAYDVLWAAHPPEGDETGEEVVGFDLNQLLPPNMHSYRYGGSLSTPPCTEGVSWSVLTTPVTVSQEQIDGFRYDGNSRPLQDINDRLVLADKS